jgi:hypothetical protein
MLPHPTRDPSGRIGRYGPAHCRIPSLLPEFPLGAVLTEPVESGTSRVVSPKWSDWTVFQRVGPSGKEHA